MIVEWTNYYQFILFGYEINVFSDNNNLLYAATLSESQRVMRWWLIIKWFGNNINHIYGVENILSHMIRRLSYATNDQK